LTASRKAAPTLLGIVVFKLVRGAILLAIALKAFALVGEALRPHFDAAVHSLRLDPETEFFDHLGDRIDELTPKNIRWAATGALLYGLLSLAEALGLALRVRWARLLVVAESAFFVPVETYALVKSPSLTILLVLIVNVAIVSYLHRNRDRLFHHA
jgi:uncharacterized membrane protein (DUF2068 family)